MLWKVRAVLEDRPGAMAALAACCGARRANILGLQIFPAADGAVVDELVLHTPEDWVARDVEEMCLAAGVPTPVVRVCSARALEDPPVRHLRAAQVVTAAPERLVEQLCALLEAAPVRGVPGGSTLVLDDGDGPPVALERDVAFTDTERARAAELRRLATTVPLPETAQEPAGTAQEPAGARPPRHELVAREGRVSDVAAVVAMHARCSAEVLRRRFHAAAPEPTAEAARRLLAPSGGFSIVLTRGDDVVAHGLVAPDGDHVELALLVEDRWQRQGLGTRLMRALAVEAAGRGVGSLTLLVQPDNDAVLATVRRAGLRARVRLVDGVVECRVPVARLVAAQAERPARRSNRPAMGQITTPLATLLHRRGELREVYPAADLIDQAVRGGA